MPYILRIKEGEIRLLIVGSTLIFVVYKKPKKEAKAFSETMFLEAEYSFMTHENWTELI